MPNGLIDNQLEAFVAANNIRSKGQLCVVLVLTRIAASHQLPFDHLDFITSANGQVKGLGKAAVQRILAAHGITKVLAEEGGRTSRGSMGLMMAYLQFLNTTLQSIDDLSKVEHFWIQRVRRFFDAKPFRLHLDRSRTIKSAFQELILQAEQRQSESPGTTYVGAMFQHLVGAKLQVALPGDDFPTFGYSVADHPTQRQGDFQIGDCAIHVTTFPSESLLRKCADNLRHDLRPIIVTSARGAIVAESMAANMGIRERIEVIELAQFLSTNLLEWSKFDSAHHSGALERLITAYNTMVMRHETDPSLCIAETSTTSSKNRPKT
jgi:Domain of unknown function (DUF4928)